MPFRLSIAIIALALLALTGVRAPADVFLPCSDVYLKGGALPTGAEIKAVRSFTQAVARHTGLALPQVWGDTAPAVGVPIRVGNAGTPGLEIATRGIMQPERQEPDIRNQSYVIGAAPEGGAVVAGLGVGDSPRAILGLGYALGELLRLLEQREGVWGFAIPDTLAGASPGMPNRTLYLMNSDHMNPGLSLEFFGERELEDYVDFLVAARYSRVSFWQWTANMLYPGNFESNRARNEQTHRAMRHLFSYARQRGLQVYHHVTPMHANVDLLPADPKFGATGYYGRSSICWAQPEARELARNMLRLEMEYYGPVDGYIVWFYDPGGCFCEVCHPNQAQHLLEQFNLVHDLAADISPGAEFQVSLWPTWCFHEYTDRGIPYRSVDEVQSFVRSFLQSLLAAHGPRAITVLDTGEGETSNVYNGLVDPAQFKRSAFLYTVMGLPSEAMYPFAPFDLPRIAEVMSKARDRGLEDANFFIQYAATNLPSVFAFADVLYDATGTAESARRRFAATCVAGNARIRLQNVLSALDTLQSARNYEEKEVALALVEYAWSQYYAPPIIPDAAWLNGHIRAQRHYLDMARATEESRFQSRLTELKALLASLPMWNDYARNTLSPALAGNHVKVFWRGPMQDTNTVGFAE